jgi:hypothetical protein
MVYETAGMKRVANGVGEGTASKAGTRSVPPNLSIEDELAMLMIYPAEQQKMCSGV